MLKVSISFKVVRAADIDLFCTLLEVLCRKLSVDIIESHEEEILSMVTAKAADFITLLTETNYIYIYSSATEYSVSIHKKSDSFYLHNLQIELAELAFEVIDISEKLYASGELPSILFAYCTDSEFHAKETESDYETFRLLYGPVPNFKTYVDEGQLEIDFSKSYGKTYYLSTMHFCSSWIFYMNKGLCDLPKLNQWILKLEPYRYEVLSDLIKIQLTKNIITNYEEDYLKLKLAAEMLQDLLSIKDS